MELAEKVSSMKHFVSFRITLDGFPCCFPLHCDVAVLTFRSETSYWFKSEECLNKR